VTTDTSERTARSGYRPCGTRTSSRETMRTTTIRTRLDPMTSPSISPQSAPASAPPVPKAQARRSHGPASVRRAGVADIPAISRLARDASTDEPEATSRARRLLLTHVALEHGALWIESLPDELAPRRAITAIPGRSPGPGADGKPSRPVLEQILRRFEVSSAAVVSQSEPDAGLLSALEAIDADWIISEITRAPAPDETGPELLATALRWAQAHGRAPLERVAVLAASDAERVAAVSLRVTRFAESTSTDSWWLGVTATGTGTAA